MDVRQEVIKRVSNAVHDLRNEMVAAGVAEDELWTTLTADEEPNKITLSVVFAAPAVTEAAPRRKKSE